MRATALTVLPIALPAAAAAAGPVCRPEVRGAGAACRAAGPADEGAAIRVRGAIGAAPEPSRGEGRRVGARRGADGGALARTAEAGRDEPAVLGVARAGAAFLMTRRAPGPAGRVGTWAGRRAAR